MQLLESYEQYSTLVDRAKREHGARMNNCYLPAEKIQRMIAQERFYFEEEDGGTYFLSDERWYYRLYYYFNSDAPIQIPRKNKPILIQNMYVEDRKTEALLRLEDRLRENGFRLADRLFPITFPTEQLEKKLQRSAEMTRSLLSAAGLRLVPLKREMIPAMWDIMTGTPEIPVHQIPWADDDELMEEAAAGHYICYVDQEGKLCGLCRVAEGAGYVLGVWKVVEPAYKLRGMAVVFDEYKVRLALEKGVECRGMVMDTNEKSLQYHRSVGCTFSNRHIDEWLLDAAESS